MSVISIGVCSLELAITNDPDSTVRAIDDALRSMGAESRFAVEFINPAFDRQYDFVFIATRLAEADLEEHPPKTRDLFAKPDLGIMLAVHLKYKDHLCMLFTIDPAYLSKRKPSIASLQTKVRNMNEGLSEAAAPLVFVNQTCILNLTKPFENMLKHVRRMHDEPQSASATGQDMAERVREVYDVSFKRDTSLVLRFYYGLERIKTGRLRETMSVRDVFETFRKLSAKIHSDYIPALFNVFFDDRMLVSDYDMSMPVLMNVGRVALTIQLMTNSILKYFGLRRDMNNEVYFNEADPNHLTRFSDMNEASARILCQIANVQRYLYEYDKGHKTGVRAFDRALYDFISSRRVGREDRAPTLADAKPKLFKILTTGLRAIDHVHEVVRAYSR